jgi:hypothetical protein
VLQCDHLIILLEEIQMHVNMLGRRSRATLPLIRLFYVLLIVSLIAIPASVLAAPGEAPLAVPGKDKIIFFASDGLRQDMVEDFASQGLMPAMARLLRSGARAADDGLLTQAPPNTGAGWHSLTTGAWPGVHGSTNNTFAINGQPFTNRATAFDPGILQAETLAQAAERGGKKVAQIEWAGGRVGVINGPTIDFRDAVLSPITSAPRTTRHLPPLLGCSSITLPGSPGNLPSLKQPPFRPQAGATYLNRSAPRRKCECVCWTSARINTV